jgi:hypothetical protein
MINKKKEIRGGRYGNKSAEDVRLSFDYTNTIHSYDEEKLSSNE